MEWPLIIAVGALVAWYYRETLFPKKNPGVVSGFDPHKPGVTVRDIIRAYHVDAVKEEVRPDIFRGSFPFLGVLIVAALMMFLAASTMGRAEPGIYGAVLAAASFFYWYFKGGREFLARKNATAGDTPIVPKQNPTRADTQSAVNQIRLAYSILQSEVGKEDRPEKVAALLAPASVALNKARALDARATATFPENGASVSYNVDSLGARLLFCEASLYEQTVQRVATAELPDDFYKNNEDPSGSLKKWERDRAGYIKRYAPAALIAAEKAVLYEPDSPQYLRMLAICYRHNKLPQAADAILQHALSLDPNDIETLRLMQ